MKSQQPSPSAKRRSPVQVTLGILLIAFVFGSIITNPPVGTGAAVVGQLTFILVFLAVGMRLIFTRPDLHDVVERMRSIDEAPPQRPHADGPHPRRC